MPVSIRVDPPQAMPDPLYRCEIRTDLLLWKPYAVYSPLAEDAWAEAFEVLNDALRRRGAWLVDREGHTVELPLPPRDRSWVTPPRKPDVAGVEPIYRVEGWAECPNGGRRPVELAIWPPVEEGPDTFCAPMRCELLRDGEAVCVYGATADQTLYLAHFLLRAEVEQFAITDADGRPIEIPLPPEPKLPDPP